MLVLPCEHTTGPLASEKLCAESMDIAQALVVSLTVPLYECEDDCVPYVLTSATEVGPCHYDPALTEYEVTVTKYGCKKVKDADDKREEFRKKLESNRK